MPPHPRSGACGEGNFRNPQWHPFPSPYRANWAFRPPRTQSGGEGPGRLAQSDMKGMWEAGLPFLTTDRWRASSQSLRCPSPVGPPPVPCPALLRSVEGGYLSLLPRSLGRDPHRTGNEVSLVWGQVPQPQPGLAPSPAAPPAVSSGPRPLTKEVTLAGHTI